MTAPHLAPGQFRVGDHVLIDGDRPEEGGWWIKEIVTDHPEHDGPFAILQDAEGGRSWSPLRILRHYPTYRPPALVDLLADAEALADLLIRKLSEQYDPGSAADAEAWPGVLERDRLLSRSVSHVYEALAELANLHALAARPVMFAAPSTTGPDTGEGRSPGPTAAHAGAAVSSNGAGTPAQAYSPPTTGVVTGVHPRIDALGGEPAPEVPVAPTASGAGVSSDPRSRHTRAAQDACGVWPGVGPTDSTLPGLAYASVPMAARWFR